jgi:hypothetical protein
MCVLQVEIVQWFSVEEVKGLLKESLARKDFKPSTSTFIPGPYAIAHHLLQLFVDRQDTQPLAKLIPKTKEVTYPHMEIWAGRGLFAVTAIFVVSVVLYNPFGYKTLELLSTPFDTNPSDTRI